MKQCDWCGKYSDYPSEVCQEDTVDTARHVITRMGCRDKNACEDRRQAAIKERMNILHKAHRRAITHEQ